MDGTLGTCDYALCVKFLRNGIVVPAFVVVITHIIQRKNVIKNLNVSPTICVAKKTMLLDEFKHPPVDMVNVCY